MFNPIYTRGVKDVVIPAGDSIAIKSVGGPVKVYQTVGYPNHPDTEKLISEFDSTTEVLGPYADGANLRINANAAQVLYSIGTDPIITDDGKSQVQGAPNALNATGSVTAAMLLGGILTSTTAAAVAGTVVTGTVLDAATELEIDDSVDLSILATGGNAFTLTANTGITLVGSGVVATTAAVLFRVRKTAANTFVIYRIAG